MISQPNSDIALQGSFTVSPCTTVMDHLLAAVTLSTGTTCSLVAVHVHKYLG